MGSAFLEQFFGIPGIRHFSNASALDLSPTCEQAMTGHLHSPTACLLGKRFSNSAWLHVVPRSAEECQNSKNFRSHIEEIIDTASDCTAQPTQSMVRRNLHTLGST